MNLYISTFKYNFFLLCNIIKRNEQKEKEKKAILLVGTFEMILFLIIFFFV